MPVVQVVIPASFAGFPKSVTVDGAAAAPVGDTSDYRVNPGRHLIRIEVPGYALAEGTFEIAEAARIPAYLNGPGPTKGTPKDAPATSGRPWLRPGVVLIPRLGLQLYGSSSTTPPSPAEGSGPADAQLGEDSLWLVFGLDVLYAPLTRLRLGAGALVMPQFHDATSPEWGTELATLAIAETVIPVGGSWGWALRLQGGPQLLLGGRTLESAGAEDESYCESLRRDGLQCNNEVRHMGWTAGGGAAFVTAAGPVRFRLDFTFQYLSVNVLSLEASGPPSRSHERTLTATRVLTCGGIEF